MLITPQNWPENVRAVRDRIASAASHCGRNVDSVTLLAVSKGQSSAAIEAVSRCGVEHFGESYLQEAVPKLDALAGRELTWHYIGKLQTNKTRIVAERFAWFHALDRAKIAERLAEQRPYYSPPLNVCIQVNLAAEAPKGGVHRDEAAALADVVAKLPRLRLRGLMCIPPAETELARQRHWFAETRRLYDALRALGHPLDTLSMGMSGDLEAAVIEGATMVRIGTSLFGPRAVGGRESG